MIVKFIIGYAIGVILTYSLYFGMKMIKLYENEIKKFFKKFFYKRQKGVEE